MDPRQQRTWASLTSAILELASRRPVGTLSVAEVCRVAGITRDTFYRYAAGPAELLARVLEQELVQIAPPASADRAEFDRAEIQLLRHVAAHADVYRAALVAGSDGRLRAVLERVVAARLAEYLRARPEIAPPPPDGIDVPRAHAMWVAYAAAGTVGAIADWLATAGTSDEPADLEAAAAAIVVTTPRWWMAGP